MIITHWWLWIIGLLAVVIVLVAHLWDNRYDFWDALWSEELTMLRQYASEQHYSYQEMTVTMLGIMSICFMVANRRSYFLRDTQQELRRKERGSTSLPLLTSEQQMRGAFVAVAMVLVVQNRFKKKHALATYLAPVRGHRYKEGRKIMEVVVDSGTNSVISSDPSIIWDPQPSTRKIGTAMAGEGMMAGTEGGARFKIGNFSNTLRDGVYATKKASESLMGTSVLNDLGFTSVFHKGALLLVESATFKMSDSTVIVQRGKQHPNTGLCSITLEAEIQGDQVDEGLTRPSPAPARATAGVPESLRSGVGGGKVCQGSHRGSSLGTRSCPNVARATQRDCNDSCGSGKQPPSLCSAGTLISHFRKDGYR